MMLSDTIHRMLWMPQAKMVTWLSWTDGNIVIWNVRYFVQKRTLVSDDRFDMDHVSQAGHGTLLDWWKHSGLECRYTDNAMDWASQNGHVVVLDWWKHSGLECRYTEYAMDWASDNGHVA
jgi:hypothetical protein